jgi:hypothetical protein
VINLVDQTVARFGRLDVAVTEGFDISSDIALSLA